MERGTLGSTSRMPPQPAARVSFPRATGVNARQTATKESQMLRRMTEYLACALLVCFSLPLHAAAPDPPAVFESVDVDSSSAFQFAKACVPSLDEPSFNRMVRDSLANRSTMTNRPENKTQPYLVVSGARAICVKMSDRKYPILPFTVFDGTISFANMAGDEERKLHIDLAKQIAANGFATALVVNDAGNAFQVVYLLAGEMPIRFYYHANFLKKGEFTESSFASVYRSPGGMSITARGESREHTKMFFSKSGS